ncbi:hypothetical protein BU26DRAFT_505273 [Trematosphaeria pertusa]|uniref:Secreted protein n=1 Tax=Trematosphaeria pertusa TaxID=390896 RepID=A0A6A6IF45_9PLEO|nr:uncharacterized protein BU26DRAFT_505273 [Trematosphaeria pertusa]KAF2249205.1 hypothetical protein BU26DRAFT_505273 [Trematosphaeria pertusa]
MRFLLVFTLLLAAVCFAKEGDTHCHGRNSPEGKTCNFVDIYTEMDHYCRQYYEPRLVPVHELKVPYNHAKFLGGDAYYCPWFGKCAKRPAIFMGYVRYDLNWGNGAKPTDNWNALSYQRCMEYMGKIVNACGGEGGSYETGYGEVHGFCIQA